MRIRIIYRRKKPPLFTFRPRCLIAIYNRRECFSHTFQLRQFAPTISTICLIVLYVLPATTTSCSAKYAIEQKFKSNTHRRCLEPTLAVEHERFQINDPLSFVLLQNSIRISQWVTAYDRSRLKVNDTPGQNTD